MYAKYLNQAYGVKLTRLISCLYCKRGFDYPAEEFNQPVEELNHCMKIDT